MANLDNKTAKIKECKICGQPSYQYGYCEDHINIYYTEVNERHKQRLIAKRGERFCACGEKLTGTATKYCPNCREKSYKNYGVDLKKRQEKAQSSKYPTDCFDPKSLGDSYMGYFNADVYDNSVQPEIPVIMVKTLKGVTVGA